MVNYIAKANAARLARVSGTTLFQVAADYLNDASQWYRIAALNGLIDPWINAITTLQLPSPLPASVQGNGGILGNPTPTTAVAVTPVIPTPAAAVPIQTISITPSTIAAWVSSLPTVLPATPGIAWNNGGVISIS